MMIPANQCLWRMQVHHIMQETPDVWTIPLVYRNYYPYRAGQYVLASVCDSAEMSRAYTISSMSGVGEYVTLTVRQIDDGVDSRWLARGIKRGDHPWPSDMMGKLICSDKVEDKFLLLATGRGVTPIMSVRHQLAKNRPQTDVQVTHNVRTPRDMIFANEWHNYPVTLVAENNITEGFIAGRLTHGLSANVPDLVSYTVMTCGPASYVDWVEQEAKALGVTRFFRGEFSTSVVEAATSGLKFTKLQPAREFYAPVDTTLLEALESNNVPVVAACRAGVCGYCKTKTISDKYMVSSTMMLTDAEIAEGYVLTCSCHPQGDLILAQPPDTR